MGFILLAAIICLFFRSNADSWKMHLTFLINIYLVEFAYPKSKHSNLFYLIAKNWFTFWELAKMNKIIYSWGKQPRYPTQISQFWELEK